MTPIRLAQAAFRSSIATGFLFRFQRKSDDRRKAEKKAAPEGMALWIS
jgi:hypothetical protein